MAPARIPEDDPIISEYTVYITPPSTESLYILQYPTRDREKPFNNTHGMQPLEMRIKPTSGLLEADVPLRPEFYDKVKGERWGDAVADAKAEGAHGFGIANGFAAAAGYRGSARGRSAAAAAATASSTTTGAGDDKIADAKKKSARLASQTYGGQLLREETGKPFYMIGAFRGQELHLTKVDGIVQMRPQFHYIDAQTQVERNTQRRDREIAEQQQQQQQQRHPRAALEPRTIGLTAKKVDNHEDVRSVDSTKEFLQAAQDESWTRLRYLDEETPEAYEAYESKVHVDDVASAPRLVSSLSNQEYVDAISAPRVDASGRTRQKPVTKRQRTMVDVSDDSEGSEHGGAA